MPLKKDQLLEELSKLRDQLKLRDTPKNGRAPKICSDEALREIAKRKPLKKSAFKAIQGIGDVFVSRYAEDFLHIIYAHKNATINQVSLSKQSKRVLSDYKDRLTNLSRRNRNLYTSKLSKKYGIDLYESRLDHALVTFIKQQAKTPLRLTHVESQQANKDEDSFYRHLTLLYREVNRQAKEDGAYTLHIAYPFVKGKLQGEGFEVKAPLMFFPVILERKGYDFYLKLNQEKDVVINRDLLLANNKFNHFDTIKDEPNSEDLSLQTIEKILLPFYEKNHIKISHQKFRGSFEPFENTVKADYKWMRKGKLELKHYMVLGKYKIYSSKVQEDITAILNNETYNDLLEGLLDDPYKPYDYSKSVNFDVPEDTLPNESSLTYINDLNYSQEKVLKLVEKHDKLSIWGPPGTGKSQTITSLIANQVNRGENVLVVSEKKVALDVIKSRLGYASRFALFMDDAQDKEAFYSQLKGTIDPPAPSRSKNNDPETLNAKIENVLDKLRAIYQTFYLTDDLDVPLYSLYHRYLAERQVKDNLMPKTLYEIFNKAYDPLSFKMLEGLEDKFSERKKLRAILTFKATLEHYPLVESMNLSLTRSEKIKRTKFYKTLDEFKAKYHRTLPFFKKKKLRDYIKKHESRISFFFMKKRQTRTFIKLLVTDETFYHLIKSKYHTFERANYQLGNLTPDELKYIELLMYEAPFTEYKDIDAYHHEIIASVYTGYIESFEAANQDKLYDINNYKTHMDKLSTLIAEKQVLSRETFAMNLYEDALNFSNSKRIMDIKQRIESQRRWSVSKFINTFHLELFSNVKVWMMTPEVISEIIPLNYAMFDLVIFDEASQMFVEKAIPTIFRAKKVVVAGDTKQLRPSSLGQGRLALDDELLEDDDEIDITLDAQSLLDLARYKYHEAVLNYHYRSKYEELISFSNYAFYEGKLIVSPNKIAPKKPPIEYFICEDGLWENRRNLAEAKKVITLIKRAIRDKSQEDTIGVITFNTAQRNLVEDLLDEEIFKQNKTSKAIQREMHRLEDSEDRSLFVKNIENVQGDERDIIIFTTAYAKNKDGRFLRQFGWLNNEGGQNRLNVAISRAKQKVYIVTSFHPEAFRVEDLKGEGPKKLKQYLQYCYYISNKETFNASKVLEALSDTPLNLENTLEETLQTSIYKRLEKEAIDVQQNIGIGKYKIDFALKPEGDSDLTLALLCDVDKDQHRQDARDIFYHQEKYLRARGFEVYRIFGPNWYKDANKEMREIRKILRD